MTLMTLNLFNITSTIMFVQCNHPLSMTLMIIIQTFLICAFTGLILQMLWFSYTLFLVFPGGIYLFIYLFVSNELFMIPLTNSIYLLLIISIMTFILWKTDLSSFLTLVANNLVMITSSLKNTDYWSESVLSLTKLYNSPTNLNTLMLMLYLFLTLIAIVSIANILWTSSTNML